MLHFQAPPNWPQPPAGWLPGDGWQPDPRWGPAPTGWRFWCDSEPLSSADLGSRDQASPAAALREQLGSAAQSSGQRVRGLLRDERFSAAAETLKRLSKDERTRKAAAAVVVAGVGVGLAVLKQSGHTYLGSVLEQSLQTSREPQPSGSYQDHVDESLPRSRSRATSPTSSGSPVETYESMRDTMNTLHTAQTAMLQNFTTPFDEWQRRR